MNDISSYISEYNSGLKRFLSGEEFSLKYSRNSLNVKLQDALNKIYIELSDDHGPDIQIIDETLINDEIIKQYTTAIKCIYDSLSPLSDNTKKPLEITSDILNKIDNMLNNLKFCVIITGNEKDAYTLFEVLNDRALEVEDLDLIKNLFFKEYCNNSTDKEEIKDNNIEDLDDIWGNEVFTQDIGVKQTKLIAYLGTVFLTANENVFTNQVQRYREIIEEKYINKKYHVKGQKYEFINVKNDFRIFQAIKLIIEEFDIPFQKPTSASLKAENDNEKSITYKTIHLINALNLDAVMPALTNLILKKFIDEFAENGKKEIEPDKFRNFLKDIKNDSEHKRVEFKDIHNCASILWKSIMLSKDYKVPREIAKIIITKVNFNEYDNSCIGFSAEDSNILKKQFIDWTGNWRYGDKNNDFKLKVLFLKLYKSSKEANVNMMKFKPAQYGINTKKIELDHLEAKNFDQINKEKYFKSDDINNRDNYINTLGNFMILDRDDNNNKNNKPLQSAIKYHENMGDHWLVEEIKDLLTDDDFSKAVIIDVDMYRVPKEEFFNERRIRLQNYFFALIHKGLLDKEIEIKTI